jgi:hypothetical protein
MPANVGIRFAKDPARKLDFTETGVWELEKQKAVPHHTELVFHYPLENPRASPTQLLRSKH